MADDIQVTYIQDLPAAGDLSDSDLFLVHQNGNEKSLAYSALAAELSGRLLAIKYITSNGTYTPTAGTNSIFVQGVGTGGNGGGSTATSSSFVTACSGGASGSTAQAWYTSGFSSVAVTIGAIGAANYATGASGGTSSFGSLMVIPGGGGGPVSAQGTSVAFWASAAGTPGAIPTLSGQVSGVVSQGMQGFNGNVYSGVCTSGIGGTSPYGSGGGNSSQGAGGSATGYGGGGGGAGVPASSAATYGGNATRGMFIVWEYA